MNKRTITMAAVGIFALGAAGFGAATAFDDPEREVDPVELTAAGTQGSAGTDDTGDQATDARATQEVEGLTQLEGTLVADPDDSGDDDSGDDSGDDSSDDDWSVSGVDLELGPDHWIRAEKAPSDFDEDGTIELIVDELKGLEGKAVTVGVRFDPDDSDDRKDDDGTDDSNDDGSKDDDATVYTIQGETYRELDGAAPWQQAPAGTELEQSGIESAATTAVGADSRAVQVEREDEDDWTGWKVDVISADGREYEVLITTAGEVLDVRLDD